MQRRIKYYDDPKIKPDLILIDGGKNQLKYAQKVLKNTIHKDLQVISIVKGAKRIRASETIITKKGILELNKYSKGFLILQEARDESHRFAIQAQRKKKRSKITMSVLDSIKGIGETKKHRLLKKFKSIKNIKAASINDLMTVDGINEKIAILLHKKFR